MQSSTIITSLALISFMIAGCATGSAATDGEALVDASQGQIDVEQVQSNPTPIHVVATVALPSPTVAPDALPTVTPQPAAAETEEPPDWTQVASVENDRFVRGNPDAPIRLLDYSDFL